MNLCSWSKRLHLAVGCCTGSALKSSSCNHHRGKLVHWGAVTIARWHAKYSWSTATADWLEVHLQCTRLVLSYQRTREKNPQWPDHRWRHSFIAIQPDTADLNHHTLLDEESCWCCANVILRMACGVTNKHRHVQSLIHTSRPRSRCGFYAVSTAL